MGNEIHEELMRRYQTSGGNASGLAVRLVVPEDFAALNSWAASRMLPFETATLPPLGVIVSDASGPMAAIWLFESFGVGVAFLHFPLSRPGLTPGAAWNSLGFALVTVMTLAGALANQPADYRTFTANPHSRALGKYLARLGFGQAIPTTTFTLNI